MITLDAFVASYQPAAGSAWGTVSEMNLRYWCFIGDVRFILDEVDFSTHWGWVPVLDFALGLSNLLAALESSDTQAFDFTESDEFICVRRVDDTVEVTASYAPGTARVGFEELRTAVREFTRQLGDKLGQEHPALRQNVAFMRALREAGSV